MMVRDDDQVHDVARDLPPGAVLVLHSTVAPTTPAEPGGAGPPGPRRPGQRRADGCCRRQPGDHGRRRRRGLRRRAAGPGGDGQQGRPCRAARLRHPDEGWPATSSTSWPSPPSPRPSRLAEAAGLDLLALGEVVRHTDAITGGPGAIMHRATAAPIAPDDFWHGVFSHVAALGEKDLGFAVALADELGVDVPLAREALPRLRKGLGI
ncbi:hypothetical protein [Nocardioides convexus]|uniref:hypothetical protein n=1 Tax=Nocardioides convexus TaxID=2712224 RepID=UPI0024189907|nr:hypothetical protein [Nocardioides convexus]